MKCVLQIFPLSLGSSFILFTVFFTEQKFLILLKSILPVFFLGSCFLCYIKKLATKPQGYIDILFFSIRNCIVFILYLECDQFLIDFYWKFEVCVWIHGFCLQMPSCSTTISWKFFSWIDFVPLSKISWQCLSGIISKLPILFHLCMYLFFYQYHSAFVTVVLTIVYLKIC